MLTEKLVRQGYFQRHGRKMSEGDLDAFLELCKMFDCLDAKSYSEAVLRVTDQTLRKVFGVLNTYVN
jgi:hypothetical protein